MRNAKYLDQWFRIAPDLIPCMWKAYEDSDVCPAREDVFHALEYFYPGETRVVILGQDPYHTIDSNGNTKASGLSFGYNTAYSGGLDSSLLNILLEVNRCYPETNKFPVDRSLENWAKQGILLLNTCLTVRAGHPLSHAHIGWQEEVEKLLKFLAENTDSIYMCWGNRARDLVSRIGVDDSRIVVTSHPCKFSHMRNSESVPAFTGSGCFREVNKKLQQIGREEIVW